MQHTLLGLLNHLDKSPVECDGMSSLVATVLSKNNIDYKGMCGQIIPKGAGTPIPHVWIEVGEWVIDFRARMWLGTDSSIPHGVFKKKDHKDLYTGSAVMIAPLHDTLFQILQMPFPGQIKQGNDEDPEP